MSEISDMMFDICRHYVNDCELPDSEKQTILGWIRSRSLVKLATASDQFPGIFETGKRYRTLKQVESFFKKNDCFSEPSVTRSAALKSFAEAEARCRITNKRVSFYYSYPGRLDPDVRLQIERAEKFISTTLGPLRTSLDKIPERVRITSGASADRSRKDSRPFEKLSLRPLAPSACHGLLIALGSYWGYKVKPRHANVNRVEFVPKSYKTDRTIACEPVGSLPIQLALDSILKDALRKRGIDLSDQTKNQRLAREGSVSGRFATIDLSMASDTLALSTVARLLPLDWYEFLKSLRSPFYQLPSGALGTYAKFSSMGNGLTFALETLIFCAICRAVGSRECVVYGDDIVIETQYYAPAVKLLRFFGFLPNEEKSFSAGPFRESCGGNYFEGEDVTPFYIMHVDDRKATLCHLINGLVRVAATVPGEDLAKFCALLVRKFELPLVPFNESTVSGVHLAANDCYDLKILHGRGPKAKNTWRSLWFRGFTSKTGGSTIVDSRSLFLWFLTKSGGTVRHDRIGFEELIAKRSSVPDSGRDVSCTWVPTAHHKYVRKWVQWRTPLEEAPLFLYRFRELLGL